MSDRDNAQPEAPENWGEYSRMLGDLPLRSLPSGADGRLHARLDQTLVTPRPRRPWLVGGLSLVGCSIALIAGVSLFSPDEQPAASTPSRPPIVSEEKSKRRSVRRAKPSRPIAPQVSETPVTIDTNIPRHIQLEQRRPDATTGGEIRSTPTPPAAASRTQPRSTP
jgi:hypothetical protein